MTFTTTHNIFQEDLHQYQDAWILKEEISTPSQQPLLAFHQYQNHLTGRPIFILLRYAYNPDALEHWPVFWRYDLMHGDGESAQMFEPPNQIWVPNPPYPDSVGVMWEPLITKS